MPSLRKIINRLYAGLHIKVLPTPVDFYTDLLNRGVPFSFSRFGDGEWSAILSRSGANCDGHEYFPELGKALAGALTSPGEYLYGMQNYALKCDGIAICRLLKKHSVKLSWHDSDVFHYANWEGRFSPFINALRKKPVIVIGPPHLRAINDRVFSYVHFIEIPAQNCFRAIDDIKREILDASARFPRAVYSFSASMAANVMIHDLFARLGKENWLIDIGSVWDVYVGVLSRGHYRSGNWREIIDRNLREESMPALQSPGAAAQVPAQ